MLTVDSLPCPPLPSRKSTIILSPTDESPSFIIGATNKSYRHQYSNIYFIRLLHLRDVVEERARQKWRHNNEQDPPLFVPRVLEVVKSKVCFILGTVYMDMPLKPNVMEDIARDRSIAPPPPPPKFCSSEDSIMLEDESGRIRLVGDVMKKARLVTGVIVAVLGAETPNGDFEVLDLCFAGLAPHCIPKEPSSDKMDIDQNGPSPKPTDQWIGLVSGLSIGSPSSPDVLIQMLIEYLNGEAGSAGDQISAAQISRLIIAGNSFANNASTLRDEDSLEPDDKKTRKYNQETTTFSPHPTEILGDILLDLAQALPVHLLPGETDPAGTILPQQPFPRGMFNDVSPYDSFICETNPAYIRVSPESDSDSEPQPPNFTRTLLVNSGQPLNDMFKYLTSPPHTRIGILESTLHWRHMAPTAPDTLWCHPYFDTDPFLIEETPDIYVVGGQKRFCTKMIADDRFDDGARRCRIIMVPDFSRTGLLVLVNLRSLAVKTVKFGVEKMTGDGKDVDKSSQEGAVSQSAVASQPAESSSAPGLEDTPMVMG